MTEHEPTAQGHGHGAVRSEPDRISTGKIVAVGIASLVVFTIAGGLVGIHFHERMRAQPPAMPAEAGRSKIGLVEQQLFEQAFRGARDREARLERLESWGWMDRRAGVAYVPIERAMELVEKGVRARPGPGPQQQRSIGGQP